MNELEKCKAQQLECLVMLEVPFYLGDWKIDGEGSGFSIYQKGDLKRNQRQKYFFREKDQPEQQINLEFEEKDDELYFDCKYNKKDASIIVPTQLSNRKDKDSLYIYFPDTDTFSDARKLSR